MHHAKESTTGDLLAFFSSAPGWWGILKLASTKPPWPRSSCKQKGWMTSPSKTALFSHHDGRAGIKIQPCGSAKHQYVDRPGWEGFHCYVGKQDVG